MNLFKSHQWLILAVFLCGVLPSTVNAGQIVTPQLRQWAQQALHQEKQLSTISKPNTIAVLNFQNLSGRPELDPVQKGLTVMLISDLSRLQMFTVIERTQLQALVEELGLGQSGLVDPEGAPRIGRLLQAEKLLGGAFLEDADHPLDIKSTVLNVNPEKVLNMDDAKGDLQGLLEIEKQLLHQFIAALKIALSPEQKAAIDKPLSRDPAALLALFTGIDAGDYGRYDEAARHYSQALALDPKLELAKNSLDELKALGLIKQTVQRRSMLHQMHEETSFSTTLNPPLPLSRIPQPAGVRSNDTRINQDLIDTRTGGASSTNPDAQPNSSTQTIGQ